MRFGRAPMSRFVGTSTMIFRVIACILGFGGVIWGLTFAPILLIYGNLFLTLLLAPGKQAGGRGTCEKGDNRVRMLACETVKQVIDD